MSSTPPELGPEGLELGVKRLGGSVGTPVVEKVQDSIPVREHGSGHGIERVKAGLVDLIVPQGEFKPGTRHGLARGNRSFSTFAPGRGPFAYRDIARKARKPSFSGSRSMRPGL